ncbi:MAG: NADH-quinone oxidoreductase subunit C [Chloroflexota bacterium]
MKAEEIYNTLKAKFPDSTVSFTTDEFTDPFATVKADDLKRLALFLRDDPKLDFDYLACLSGMDYKDSFGVVYHLYSVNLKHRFVVKVMLDRENPTIPSVERIWKTANWHEREAYDMFGINFEGHPNLIRILCCYDWEGYPLRKDYKVQEEYHGTRVPE